jgi:hypothetical protein
MLGLTNAKRNGGKEFIHIPLGGPSHLGERAVVRCFHHPIARKLVCVHLWDIANLPAAKRKELERHVAGRKADS